MTSVDAWAYSTWRPTARNEPLLLAWHTCDLCSILLLCRVFHEMGGKGRLGADERPEDTARQSLKCRHFLANLVSHAIHTSLQIKHFDQANTLSQPMKRMAANAACS